VLGAGRLGLLVAQVLKHVGASVTVIGRNAGKLDLAHSWGFTTVRVAPPSLTSEPFQEGMPGMQPDAASRYIEQLPAGSFPLVIEVTGASPGLEEALRLVEPRGTVVMKSTFHEPARFDTARLVVDEVTLLGSRCGNFESALQLLASGAVRVRELITKMFPLEAGIAAFDYLSEPSCLKVLLFNGSQISL